MMAPCLMAAPQHGGAKAGIEKRSLRPPRGALRGGGNYPDGGMGASAPIM
ncbi:hypothetical protein [Methanoregula sp. PtaB.Bin085]|nr:hypothetical protein [Methanoregula sp. PtaB.Bin085]